MKKTTKLLSLLTILSLVSCSNDLPGTSSNTDNTSSDSTSIVDTNSSNSSTSSSSIVEKYRIVKDESNGVSIDVSNENPTVGESVTIVARGTDEITLVSLIYGDETSTNVIDNTITVTFKMPDRDIRVRTTITLSNADVSLSGGLTKAFELNSETNIYEIKNLKVDSDSEFSVKVKQSDGNYKYLKSTSVDYTKTFANIGTSTSTSNITIKGGATYNFYYDINNINKPIYIQRVKQNTLPTNADSLYDLFEGMVSSEPTLNVDNVATVSYKDNVNNLNYNFTKYNDNKSYATVTKNDNEVAIVYKSLDLNSNLYTVVDSYIEKDSDVTKKSDGTSFSGVYQVKDVTTKDDLDWGFKNYQYTKHDAIYDANLPSHNMYSLDFDIMYAYRTGFSGWDDTLKYYNIDVKSNLEETGFSVNLSSYKTYVVDSSSDTATYDKSTHIVYNVELHFDIRGALLSGNYLETHYGEDQYDFSKQQFISGQENNGTIKKSFEFKYTYSTTLTDMPSIDVSKYFISSIDSITINNPNAKVSTNLVQGDFAGVNTESLQTGYTKMTYSPSTALDAWQYDVISSSNTSVIGPKTDNTDTPSRYYALKPGTVTLTYGNHTSNTVTTTKEVTVENNIQVRSYYIEGYIDEFGNSYNSWTAPDGLFTSNSASMNAGAKIKLKVGASPSNAPIGFTPTTSNNDVSLSREDNYLVIDATKLSSITESVTFTIALEDDNYETYTYNGETVTVSKTTFTITVNKATSMNIIGTWSPSTDQEDYSYYDGTTIEFTNESSTLKDGYKKGIINLKSTSVTTLTKYEFYYRYNGTTLTGGIPANYSTGTYYTLQFYLDKTNSQIGVALQKESVGSSYDDSDTTDLIGYVETDDQEAEYLMFSKNS